MNPDHVISGWLAQLTLDARDRADVPGTPAPERRAPTAARTADPRRPE
jgi:hypothetical protein